MKITIFSANFIVVLLVANLASALPAAQNQVDTQDQNQAQLDRFAEIVQRLQNYADGLPSVTNLTQQVLNELQEFRQSELFFANPCSFFQMIFRQFYCTIASFDPSRTNTAVQSFLQFLNANQMFYNFASTFFCPFAGFGGGSGSSSNGGLGGSTGSGIPGGFGGSGSTGGGSSTITCNNPTSANGANAANIGNTAPNNLAPSGFAAQLDNPQSFARSL